MNPFKTELFVDTTDGKDTIFYGHVTKAILITQRNGEEVKYLLELYNESIRVGSGSYPFYPYTLLDQLGDNVEVISVSINALSVKSKQILLDQNVAYGRKRK